MTSTGEYLQTLKFIIGDIVAPQAEIIDKTGQFPRAAIEAFGREGLMGLISAKEKGGMGLGLAEASQMVEILAQTCPSTAMIMTMHFSGTAVIEKLGGDGLRQEIAQGKHLTTLAWSEEGSRSHFWAPQGTARKDLQGGYWLDGKKTMVTSAQEADSFVWTSKPVSGEGAATMWLVRKGTSGLNVPNSFDGLGLRGNASAPMWGEHMKVPDSAMLGSDGGGFDIMIGTVLPLFSVLSASCSLGMMEAVLTQTIHHVTGQRLEHLKSSLAELPTVRAYLAKSRISVDMIRALRGETLSALRDNRPEAMLRVMQVKAAAAEGALEVTDTCMRVCAGAAFRKNVGIERFFRDARAAHIMAPTSDVLFDFIGKAICDQPVFG